MTQASLDPLTSLAVKHGSDKFGSHLYTPVYHQLFQHLRDKPIRFLEIGVGGYDIETAGGLSLRMWADYFPKAQIVGLDIHPKKLAIAPHVHLVCGSQSDPQVLAKIVDDFGPFDIIIDDGSHRASDAKASFYYLYPRMTAQGIYVVEDIQTSFAASHDGNRAGVGSMFDLAHRLSLVMHLQEGYIPKQSEDPALLALDPITFSIQVFRNQIVFQRGSNRYPSVRVLDFSSPEVQMIYTLLDEEAKRAPSTGSYLTRIDMNIWAKRVDIAAALALEGAERFPHEIAFLTELVRLMMWAEKYDVMEILRLKVVALMTSSASV